jgi:hypothetical protein
MTALWDAAAVLETESVSAPPSRRNGGRRRRRAVVASVVGAAVLGASVILVTRRQASTPLALGCTVAGIGGGRSYVLTPEQAQNASIIAAMGSRLGMADHATTVALATSLVESQLRNLPYGDRDSVGLFQQRPSQGWGARAQLLDPTYAASAFHRRLAAVRGWETMAVTEAAQAVQHSASPTAYARWEGEARALAQALTGEIPAGIGCRLTAFGGAAPAPSAVGSAATQEFGSAHIGVPLGTKEGWATAAWAVAHSYNYHLASVAFAGQRWSSSSGRWTPDPTAARTVAVTPAAGAP